MKKIIQRLMIVSLVLLLVLMIISVRYYLKLRSYTFNKFDDYRICSISFPFVYGIGERKKIRRFVRWDLRNLHIQEGIGDNNDLEVIIEERNKFKSINFIKLFHFGLDSFPLELCEFTELIYLDLDLNNLKQLPIEINKLHNLQYLQLRSNNLTNLPIQIRELKKLKYLYLGGNLINK